ncbi:Hypothetical predicted protein [Olea europaea subsp. europaea]|uniref:Uncharacterized protein n=1 Tax=Olea europaea subsp. europaea TaxID=158383 RepID=A0A8S0S8Q3_OLEEU|nr:Hypothetical predicted protein [Olea europaea subsp. europaea]
MAAIHDGGNALKQLTGGTLRSPVGFFDLIVGCVRSFRHCYFSLTLCLNAAASGADDAATNGAVAMLLQYCSPRCRLVPVWGEDLGFFFLSFRSEKVVVSSIYGQVLVSSRCEEVVVN